MEVSARRENVPDAVPTAKFLQARITALSTTLIKRLENIFAVALDGTSVGTIPPASAGVPPPSLTDTAVQEFQLDIESAAVIRAAEEIMVLTRTMKEIWLFGGLDTLEKDHENDNNPQNEATKRKVEEDTRVVEEGFKKFLEKYETTIDWDDQKTKT
ncbi:hypothetical protein ABEF92_001024 [Exophiala dermatitidis]|uniref:Mediator of RNA polymerase II transcription subunit 22 n=2 Tax=Exophiala dermatitidis TaxID=5970 RepID=H6CAE1_EXODN|nr:uncharacterized protein HMPREF1120_08077 [Exophiala dermatitidis NIH/UT8656]EHY60105.1 hypothetical protein HMPREF1120_08077 [Exophiala dermatitidis NIH/UT8656]KAJ4503617.1 hypothetical protein HRR75_008011 [Exophiala dermatitidis]KAJ4551287.1 hypothetical protein HRR78_003964 [Exophiala dermatitidis]